MERATISRIDPRFNPRTSNKQQYHEVPGQYSVNKEELLTTSHRETQPDDTDGDEPEDNSTGWSKLWRVIFVSYLPVTIAMETFLIVLMNSWPTQTPAEAEFTSSVANGWVNMVFMQVLLPILSFFIRSLVGFFLKRRFSINLMNRMSKGAIIPMLAVAFLFLVFISTLFAYMTKNFNLFTFVTTGFLFISFYFSGIIMTLSWVVFILERENPYEAH